MRSSLQHPLLEATSREHPDRPSVAGTSHGRLAEGDEPPVS
jgi:hypothetical protein